MQRGDTKTFLTATWKHLAMLNWEIDEALVMPFVPRGTLVDTWNGKTFASLVAFQFLDTRVWGLKIPFHINFEEVNLRLYVKRPVGGEVRRGVVFVKEFVPSPFTAFAARALYNENYVATPMSHGIKTTSNSLSINYQWGNPAGTNAISLTCEGQPQPFSPGSQEEFITEHYWGYVTQRDGSTKEYQVLHPPWKVWQPRQIDYRFDIEKLYGKHFAEALSGKPSSIFVADGSPISVSAGGRF